MRKTDDKVIQTAPYFALFIFLFLSSSSLYRRIIQVYFLGSTMSIMDYNGGTVLAMAGDECICIASDLRFGEQMTTVAVDQKKV